MTCYYYKKINHVDNPILSNVDATFILTMEKSITMINSWIHSNGWIHRVLLNKMDS